MIKQNIRSQNSSFQKFFVCHWLHQNFEKKVETYCDYNKNNILYIFFQTPSIDQIVQKIMMKHRGTYHTEDQMLAKILGLKQLKPAPAPQTPLTEQVSML